MEKKEEAFKLDKDGVQVASKTESTLYPPPGILKEYKELGVMDRILSTYDLEQKHRHEMNKELIKLDKKEIEERSSIVKRSIFTGLFISAFLIGASTYLILENHDVAGGVMITTTIGMIFSSIFRRNTSIK